MAEGQDEKTGQFTKGNRLWERSLNSVGSLGDPPKYTDPNELIEDAKAYFADLDDNPLLEAGFYGKDATLKKLPKMRAPTIKGLCCWLGITDTTWYRWREERPDLQPAIEMITQTIWVMKLEGTAAGFLNPNIIAREMGLADVKEVAGKDGGAIQIEGQWTDMEIARRLAFTVAKAKEKMDQMASAEDAELIEEK